MNLPDLFITRTKALLGNEWDAFYAALDSESPTSVRLNPRKYPRIKTNTPDYVALPIDQPVPWASNAYYLQNRPTFTLDPLFHAGCYYVQEASSMSLEQLIRPYLQPELKVLDLCAAPGGKSTHLISLLSDDSLLVANETIRQRVRSLTENVTKWGYPNVLVTNKDPQYFSQYSQFFDIIVADLPCSGEGMFRKDANSINEWSIHNIKLCADRQKRIMADCWESLKPSGLLIYSTCTYNIEENEDNLEWICHNLGARIISPPQRFFPHQIQGEGFCISMLQKNDMPENYDADPKRILQNLNAIRIPPIQPHTSAMSVTIDDTSLPVWEVDRETALRYLQREALYNMPEAFSKGMTLISYAGVILGFVKNITHRANNLYPNEWRIRQFVPPHQAT